MMSPSQTPHPSKNDTATSEAATHAASRLRGEAAWLAQSVGYWIRPYDMLADRRRWRWQKPQRCGFSYGIRL